MVEMGEGVVTDVPAAPATSALRQRSFQALFAGSCFDQISHSVGVIFTPLYLGELGASPALVGLVIGVSAFAYPFIILGAGSIIERVPPRRLILLTRGVVAVGLLGAALAQAWWQLAPALALVASGSLAYPSVSRAIAESTSPDERARAFTLVYGIGSNLSLILAPAMGGVVAAGLGLRWVYVVALALEIVSLACFTRVQSPPADPARRLTATYREVAAYRPVLALSLFLLVANIVLMTGFSLLPTYLHDYRGISVGAIGRLGSLGGVGGMLLALALARSRRRVRPASSLLLALAFAPLALALLAAGGQFWVIAAGAFVGGSYLMVWPLVDAAVGNVTPERLRPRAFAFSEVMGGMGVAIGPMIAGVVYDVGARLPLILALVGTLMILLPAMLLLRGLLDRAQVAVELEEQQAV